MHCYLIHYLRKQMPQFFGKEEKQQKLLADLAEPVKPNARIATV